MCPAWLWLWFTILLRNFCNPVSLRFKYLVSFELLLILRFSYTQKSKYATYKKTNKSENFVSIDESYTNMVFRCRWPIPSISQDNCQRGQNTIYSQHTVQGVASAPSCPLLSTPMVQYWCRAIARSFAPEAISENCHLFPPTTTYFTEIIVNKEDNKKTSNLIELCILLWSDMVRDRVWREIGVQGLRLGDI